MSPSDPHRFESLLAGLFDEELTPEERGELEQILLSDAAARDQYCEYVKAHALLTARASAMSGHLPQSPELSSGDEPASREIAPAGAASGASLLSVGYWRAHPARFVGLALSLTLIFWAGIFYVVFSSRVGGGPELPSGPVIVAEISKVLSPNWADTAEPFVPGQSLMAGETLQLASGYVEIKFAEGGVVLLQGPSQFTVDTRGAGTLEQGRLVARIEKRVGRSEVVPFAISTPLAQIIDLGTEFGVAVEDDGTTDVKVFEGRVEAMTQGSLPRRTPIRLEQGQSARIAPGNDRFVRTEESLLQFAQELPAEEGEQVLTPVSVAWTGGESFNPPERLLDASGLHAEGPLSAWRHDGGVERFSWKASVGSTPNTLTFDLGDEYNLSSLWIWNYSHPNPDYLVRATRKLRVEISRDGNDFTAVGDLELLTNQGDSILGQRFALAQRARYVRIVVLETNGNGGEVGLGEVRFEGVLAPQDEGDENS